jgi:hypothetical protein
MKHVGMKEHEDIKGWYLDILQTLAGLVEIELGPKHLSNPQFEAMD